MPRDPYPPKGSKDYEDLVEKTAAVTPPARVQTSLGKAIEGSPKYNFLIDVGRRQIQDRNPELSTEGILNYTKAAQGSVRDAAGTVEVFNLLKDSGWTNEEIVRVITESRSQGITPEALVDHIKYEDPEL